MAKAYIAFHENKGIYLGAVAGYAIFSTNNIVFTPAAIKFDSAEELQDFFDKTLPNLSKEISAIEIETNTETEYYINVVDIIKSGHIEHTETMVDNMLMINETIH
jgi:hypothetical protein